MGKKISVEYFLNEVMWHDISYDKKKGEVVDNLEELISKCSDDLFFYVGVNKFVQDYYEKRVNSEWKIWGVFQLGYPFGFPATGVITDEDKEIKLPKDHPGYKIRDFLKDEIWSLFVFSKEDFDTVKIGFNNCNDAKLIYRPQNKYDEMFYSVRSEKQFGKPFYMPSHNVEMPGMRFRIIDPCSDYYKLIQKTIEKRRLVERRVEFETYDEIDFEFTEIPKSAFYVEYLNVLYRYKDEVVELFGYPDDAEDLEPIKEHVDFLEDRTKIQEGDILFNYLAVNISERKYKVGLSIAETNKTKAKFKFIIRPKNLSSYYVYNYLQSVFVKEFVLNRTRNIQEDAFEVMEEHRGDENELEFYKNYYFMDSYIHDNDEDWNEFDIQEMPLIINHKVDTEYFKKKYEWEKQEKMALQRRLEKKSHSKFYNQDAKDIILRDMNELRSCFTSGTYKAAIILAGSILEAFLIDWLSEIHDKDFFNEDFMVFDKYRNKYRRADLKDYISSIAELKKPNWFDAASKATEIRKKRNLVHAKLYINDADISRETCTEVINYLEYVINTRWK